MKTTTNDSEIVVAGDVTVDWDLATTDASNTESESGVANHMCFHWGGAALLADLIEAVVKNEARANSSAWKVHKPSFPRRGVHPGDPRFNHSYAVWAPTEDIKGSKKLVWRMVRSVGRENAIQPAPKNQTADPPVTSANHVDADIVVLDDAGLGFREQPKLWPSSITDPKGHPQVVLKMSDSIASGPLWERLIECHADKLTVVVGIDSLRSAGIQVSRRLSWEKTAEDLVDALLFDPRINGLLSARNVVVSIGYSGALVLTRSRAVSNDSSEQRDIRLHFDPVGVEGTWVGARPAHTIGAGSCLTACIVRELLRNGDDPDVNRCVDAGLCASRRLHELGYGPANDGVTALAFPTKEVLDEKRDSITAFSQIPVPVAPLGGRDQKWTILASKFALAEQSSNLIPSLGLLRSLSELIVSSGPESVLKGVPVGKFGKLVTVDRHEIESLMAVGAVMEEYLRSPGTTPISIAVFGPPGCGKSFAVKQIGESIMGPKGGTITFNLTQFAGEADLIGAFHQIRDLVLAGKTPLVFWDEFDAGVGDQKLWWLSKFLAPMQDGQFQEGQITHSMGRAVFVFAGGIYPRMTEFDRGRTDQQFVDAKGPDFVSRLKGFINVMGPNSLSDNVNGDPFSVVRRAILLRSMLERREPRLFEGKGGAGQLRIDRGVLRALLFAGKYTHGARSMESILSMCSLTGKTKFVRACLPAGPQADLHVDGKGFMKMVEQLELEDALLEKLAEAAHNLFRKGKERDGWTLGPRNNENLTHPLITSYAEIPETYKESNRATVRNIPRKLAVIGCAMMPRGGTLTPAVISENEIEKMAEMEHELWMEDREAAGFVLGEPTEAEPRRTPYLVPWSEVPEDIKVIDRDLVNGIPDILEEAQYMVVRVQP